MELGEASAAYRAVYDVSENCKPTTIWVNAHKVLANAKVAQRIEQLQSRHRKRHEVTVDSLTKELEEARELARGEKQAGPMVSSSMGKAKLHGLGVERVEHTLGDDVLTALQGARSRVSKKKD